ncbi:hypothetical protein ACJJTC_003813 [Scirpophaga incertulas]
MSRNSKWRHRPINEDQISNLLMESDSDCGDFSPGSDDEYRPDCEQESDSSTSSSSYEAFTKNQHREHYTVLKLFLIFSMGPIATNTMNRINENGNVVGTIIVNAEGFPETTTLDSLTAATYSTHMRNLCHYAANALKEIDVTDDLVVLRLVSRKTEAVVTPDHEFHLIVVMRRH